MTIRYCEDHLLTLAAASRSSFCFCSKDSMDNGSLPGAIFAVLPGVIPERAFVPSRCKWVKSTLNLEL